MSERTPFLARLVGRATTTVAGLGYGLSRRLAGRPSVEASRRRWLERCLPAEGAVLVDVGANAGQFARAIEACPGVTIVSIEPVPELVEACRARFAGRPGYEIMQAAVGAPSTPGTITIHAHPYSQASSLLPLSSKARDTYRSLDQVTREITVPFTSLDALLVGHAATGTIDLLKIDVEGYEGEVMAGATAVLARSRALLVETQAQRLHEGSPLLDDVCHRACAAGFSLAAFFSLIPDLHGEPLLADLLFRRDDEPTGERRATS